MGTGYTRKDTVNNIADGNIINAADLDLEFDGVEAAFDAATGHTHDGTTGEGAPIEVTGPAQEYVSTGTELRPKTNNTYDLGSASLQWKDLYVDGTANLDTVDIDAGAIDGTVIGGATPAAGTFTTLTATGNVTLGDAATDTVTITADVASNIIPSADNTYDLGASGSEWKDLYIDGTANIDSLVADTADINGGTIDGVTIGGASAGAGTFTNVTATGTINLSGATVSNGGTVTTVDINGGTIDGTVIGGSTPAAISGTTITGTSFVTSGNMTFGDNDKAIFGAGSDLQIYHDGASNIFAGNIVIDGSDASASIASPAALNIKAGDANNEYSTLRLATSADGSLAMIGAKAVTTGVYPNTVGQLELAVQNGATTDTVLTVTSTGVDVTGTVTADGLTVSQAGGATATLANSTAGSTVSPQYTNISFTGYAGENRALIRGVDISSSVGGGQLDFLTGNASAVNTRRMNINRDGDISFYEDTGTTPKFFWDASAERLGLGTTSPAQIIHAIGGSYTGLRLETSDALGASYIDFGDNSDPDVGGIQYFHTDNSMRFVINAAERMRITSTGNVGIGTSSPNNELHVVGAISVDGDGSSSTEITSATVSSVVYQDLGGFDGTPSLARAVRFFTNPASAAKTERMRIDASGNFLVGTTSNHETLRTTSTEDGFAIGADSYTTIANDGRCLVLNRRSTDGNLLEFNKDGTAVGSISTNSGRLEVNAAGSQGRLAVAGTDYYTWTSAGFGVVADNARDLGSSSYRFKDLYLSGGVYLGGTVAANYLDDYEEGSVTLTMGGGTLNPLTTQSTTAFYTKVGDVVKLWFKFSDKNNTGASGVVEIDGLPFAVNATQDGYGTAWGGRDSAGGTGHKVYLASAGTTSAKMIDGNGNNVTWASTGTGTFQGGFIVYKV